MNKNHFMKFRIQIIKTSNAPDTYNPQIKTSWLGRWRSIIYLPHDFSNNPFELLEYGKRDFPNKHQAQGIIDAYKKYNNLKFNF